MGLSCGETIRIPHYATVPNRWRVYIVVAVVLGGLEQEGTYELRCCDILENECVRVPCVMLETHPLIQIYRVDKWMSLPIVLEREAK